MGGNASQLAARAIASIEQATYTHNDFLSSFAFFVDYLGIVVNLLDLKFAAPHDGLFSPVEGRRQVPLDGAKESLAFCVCVSKAGVHGIVVDGIIQKFMQKQSSRQRHWSMTGTVQNTTRLTFIRQKALFDITQR